MRFILHSKIVVKRISDYIIIFWLNYWKQRFILKKKIKEQIFGSRLDNHNLSIPLKCEGKGPSQCFISIFLSLWFNILSYCFLAYNQTWANGHLWIMTTCLQRPPFKRPIFKLYNISYFWTRATCQQRPWFLGPKGGCCTQVWLCIRKLPS